MSRRYGFHSAESINTKRAPMKLTHEAKGTFAIAPTPFHDDGRIDDAGAGWKGRELWATVSTRAPFHMEGGKGTTSKVLKFQLRPDPLAH